MLYNPLSILEVLKGEILLKVLHSARADFLTMPARWQKFSENFEKVFCPMTTTEWLSMEMFSNNRADTDRHLQPAIEICRK